LIGIALVLIATVGICVIVVVPHRSGIGWTLLSAVGGGAVSFLLRQRRKRHCVGESDTFRVNHGSNAHGIR